MNCWSVFIQKSHYCCKQCWVINQIHLLIDITWQLWWDKVSWSQTLYHNLNINVQQISCSPLSMLAFTIGIVIAMNRDRLKLGSGQIFKTFRPLQTYSKCRNPNSDIWETQPMSITNKRLCRGKFPVFP